MLQKVNKLVEGKISLIRDQRTKKEGNKETAKQLKSCKIRDVPIPADIVMDI